MKNKFKIPLILFLILACLFTVSCKDKNEDKLDHKNLKLGVLSLEDILPMVVANEKGYFAQKGIKVELIPFQSAIESQTAIQSGQIDGMMTDLIVAALLKDSGTDLKITSVTLEATDKMRRFAILAAPDSGITNINELTGKTLGISFNSIIEYVSDGILTGDGVEPIEIEKTAIPKIPVRLEMLLNNKIAAATLPDPLAEFAEFNGCQVIGTDLGKNFSQAVLVMTEKALADKKAELIKFYEAYELALIEINNSPQDFKELMISQISIPEAIVNQYELPSFPALKLPSEGEVEQVLTWLQEKELIKGDIVYEEFVEKELY